jgi:glycosyltransferase involved in cell wall biosynthesis
VIYISAIPLNGGKGQSVFESTLLDNVKEVSRIQEDIDEFLVITPLLRSASEFGSVSDGNVKYIHLPLLSKSILSYLLWQYLLFRQLLKEIRRKPKGETVLFVRYHDSMIAPALLRMFYKFRLVMRTGPVLPNLFVYKSRLTAVILYLPIKFFFVLHLKLATTVITVTATIRDWCKEQAGGSEISFKVLPNFADLDGFDEVSDPESFRDNKIRFGFVGHVYVDQGLEVIVKAIAGLKRSSSVLPIVLVVGGGPQRQYLIDLAISLGVGDCFEWIGEVPHSSVPGYISQCDVMLAPFTKRTFQLTGSSAMKIFEYLACDRPVLASRGDDHLFIEKNNLGALVEPEIVGEWADLIRQTMEAPQRLSGNGRKYVEEHHSAKSIANRFVEILLE